MVARSRQVHPAGAVAEVAAAGNRLAHLDNLKVLLVAGVIFGHGWAGYDELGSWAYTDAREVSIAPVTETILEVLLGPFALFAMGLFFLIAGLLTPASLARKTPRRFARDRILRLGAPLAVFTLVLWPPVGYLTDRAAGHPTGSLWSTFAHSAYSPDPAHLWFAEVLLVFSLGYAGWRRLRPTPAPRPGSSHSGLTLPYLLGLAVAVAGASFLVRLRFPLDTSQYADLHLSQWPQYLALYGLGLAGGQRGWLDPVPDRLRRECGIAALTATLAIAGFAGAVATTGVPTEVFLGGWHWAALATAAAEGVLAVTVSVWLLALVQRHLNQRLGQDRAARSAYAAFLVQGHVLVGLALAVRPFGAPAEVKALVVSVLGVLASFGLGWILVTRTALRRIL